MKNVYEANTKYGANKEDLRKTARFNYILARTCTILYIGTSTTLFCAPAINYKLTGQLIPIMPVKLLFVPSDNLFGYILHVIFHSFGMLFGVIGLIALDIFMITTTIHIWPMTRILERACTNLNRATRLISRDAVRDSVWLKLQMRNIMLMHKENYL